MPNPRAGDVPTCPNCEKPTELCVCSHIKPHATNLHVLILQHPQEPDKLLGSARITKLALENSTLKVGLSWSNITKALGRPSEHAKWGVLFLGGKSKAPKPAPGQKLPPVVITNKSGKVFSQEEAALEGIVVLDGTWAQAKTMWWRNPWLLKLKRVALNPQHRSLYGNLRKEPRRECLSTLEAVAETLEALGENPEVSQDLRTYFKELLAKYKATQAKPAAQSTDSAKQTS